MITKRLNEIDTAAQVSGNEKLVAVSGTDGGDVLIPLSKILELIRLPENANFRFKDSGTFQILNVTTQKFHSVYFQNDASGKPVLEWAEEGDL